MKEIVLAGRGPNALNAASLSQFREELDRSRGDAILIRGAGSAFSAGLDLDELSGDVRPLLEAIEEVIATLFLHPAPTVACVNGHAIAGGCLLAIACDHRVVASDPKLRMGMTAVSIELVHPPTVLEVLRYRLPSHALDRALLGAERFNPEEALALGMVDEIADDPLAVARQRGERLAAHPREPYAQTKRALRRRVIAMDETERRALLEEAVHAWDPSALRKRLDR